MKLRVLILFVCILLVGTAIPKDVRVAEKMIEKGYFPSDEYVTDQSGRRNFLAVALVAYPVVNNMVETVVSRSDSDLIRHYFEYYSDASKSIRIHVTVTGPEFATYTSEKLSVDANTYYYWWINWASTWKTGVYKVTFIIEVIGGKGGSTLVETYSFIVV